MSLPDLPDLEQVLADVEAVCNRAAEVARASAKLIVDRPAADEDLATVYVLALESVAVQLDEVAKRALFTRTNERVRGFFKLLDKPPAS